MANVFKLVIAIVVSELAGIVGAVFTTPSIAGWYSGLEKPALNPPSWIFGPVWTTLYALMGIALFLVWQRLGREQGIASSSDRGRNPRNDKGVKIALGVFTLQLLLNVLWSVLFFGLHAPGGALVDIVALWAAILATIIAFANVSRPAAWLLVPYLLWVSFAFYLNYSIWTLN
jgi:tryptophan-rich sensory protein